LDVKTLKFGEMYPLGNPDTARLLDETDDHMEREADEDFEAECEDEGSQCEDEGADSDDETSLGSLEHRDDQTRWGLAFDPTGSRTIASPALATSTDC
jgi:hypothetical protein